MVIADAVTPVTQGITFAVIGGFFTVLTLVLTNRAKHQAEQRVIDQTNLAEEYRRVEKEEDREAAIAKENRDYARQDEVAARVERATVMTMRKLDKVEGVVDVTHALVNSDKTATMKDQRDGWMVTLALMREVISLKEQSGKEPTAEAMQAVAALEQRIATLNSTIEDRLAQQLAAEQRVELDQAQAGAAADAADRQVAAAEVQQVAADQQQAAADQISSALAQSAFPPPTPPTPQPEGTTT